MSTSRTPLASPEPLTLRRSGPNRLEAVLLTQQHCGFCDDAKRLLAGLAGKYDLTVREVDLTTTEGEALARDTGVLLPPGIIVDGQALSHGRPSEWRVRRELSRLAARR